MKIYRLPVIATAAIVSAAIVSGWAHPAALAQTTVNLAQVSAPAAPVGLPRLRDYEVVPELRDIYFDFGEAVIRPGDARILDANSAWLRANPDLLVLIEGHCDTRGLTASKHEFNLALGERRAKAIANYLSVQGVDAANVEVVSYGEEKPVVEGHDEDSWAKNRRVELKDL